MLKQLGSRDDLIRYSVGSFGDLDAAALATLMTDAWALDYVDHLRPDFGEHYLQHALTGSSWVGGAGRHRSRSAGRFRAGPGTYALHQTHPPESLLRHPVYGFRRAPPAWYWPLGAGRYQSAGIRRKPGRPHFSRCSIVARPGSPTVQATYDDISAWGSIVFTRPRDGVRRIDKEPLPSVPEPPSASHA